MKEVQVETKSFKTIYRAIDGTDFTNKEDCEQYEQSARGVIMGRFKRLVIAETDEWELLRGDSGCGVYALKIESGLFGTGCIFVSAVTCYSFFLAALFLQEYRRGSRRGRK